MAVRAAEIELVAAGERDLPALAALRAQLSGKPDDADALARAAERFALNLRHGCRATGFRLDGRLVGYALWLDLGDHVFLRQFVIDAGHRGRGLGREAFRRLVAEVLPPRGEIRLEVMEGGPQGFWSGLGFAPRSTGMRLALEREEA